MLASCPSSADRVANSLPTWREICNFKNGRVKSNNLLQANKLGISRRSVGSADELPAMIVGIVRDEQYRL